MIISLRQISHNKKAITDNARSSDFVGPKVSRHSRMRDGPSVQVGGSFIDLSSPNLASCTRGT